MSGWSGVTGAAGDTPAGTPVEAGGGTVLTAGAVGFPTALASAVGLIMASPVILTATSGFGMGGWAFAVAMIIAFVMMQAQATTFSEAAAMLPTAGSVTGSRSRHRSETTPLLLRPTASTWCG